MSWFCKGGNVLCATETNSYHDSDDISRVNRLVSCVDDGKDNLQNKLYIGRERQRRSCCETSK